MNIGYNYYYGEGVKKDVSRAMMWFKIAAENGSEQGQEYLDVVEAGLSIWQRKSKMEQTEILLQRCKASELEDC